MNDIALRIRELIEKENLSNKEFAQKLSINPSIISHILSGRNKVSLQVVEQIVKVFTNVSLDYLLLGSGSLYKGITNVNYNSNSEPKQKVMAEEEKTLKKAPQIPIEAKENKEKKIQPNILNSSEIDQVIIFYNDGSIKVYKP